MAADDNYAPKSPDLSSLYSAGPTTPAPQLSQQGFPSKNYLHADYKQEPQSFAYNFSPPPTSSYNPPPVHLNNQPHQHNHHQLDQAPPPPFDQPRTVKSELYSPYSPPAQYQYIPPDPAQNLPPALDYNQQGLYQQPPYNQPYHDQGQNYSSPSFSKHDARLPGASAPSSSKSPTSNPQSSAMPPRRAPPPPAPVIEPSPVRTKFPTARIKRIMQADEEVGKVAQQTPIAVGKALELFMIQMVSKSAEVAQEKGSKRVTAAMLKQVVETDEQWDFLRDIVSRVENEKEGSKSKAKAESSSDEEIPEPKKRTRGGGRKKKAA